MTMAQLKSPRRDQILQDHIRKLVESRPSNRSSIYLTLTQVAITAIQKGEGHEIIHLEALPTTFKDIVSGNESQTLDALGFLGGLLQFLKLNVETQMSTIELLSQKLKTVTSKGQSRKLMWSLANIQFDEQLPTESLDLMLSSALLYLDEKPPIHSLSTMCEALNTLKNMGQRRSKFMEENLPDILSVVFPCLFNEADRIRQLALECLVPFTETIQARKLLNSSYQAKLKNTFYSSLMKLVSIEAPDSLRIWGFLIAAFGTEMQSVSLLNGLLKIEETALKSKNSEFRQMALEHWRFIIDCFALTPSILNNSKRIHLILVPLKSTESRTEEFSFTKIHLWWHLLNQLGMNAVHRYEEVTSLLLNFCFGSDGSTKGNVHIYPNTNTLSASILASVLSPRPKFTVGSLARSFLYLDTETFSKFASDFIHYSCVACSALKNEHRDVIEAVFHAFIERCNVERQYFDQLNNFIYSILKIILDKELGFFESFLVSLTSLIPNNPMLNEALMTNIRLLFQWAGKHEPLPTHPFFSFLKAFFKSGVEFNLNKFSSSLVEIFEAVHTDDFDYFVLAELWKEFVISVLSFEPSLPLSDMNEKTLIIPFKWIPKPLDEDIYSKWRQLFVRLKIDKPGSETVISNSFSLENNIMADDQLVRFLIRALSRDASQHMSDIETWFNKWITSWVSGIEVNESSPDCVDFLPNLILFINELPSDAAEPLLLELKMAFQTKQSSNRVSELLKIIFDSSGSSKSKAIQKLRANRKICKMFSGTPNQRSTSRSRTQNKTMDDFVVIPPTPKSKRILTERQKEVMRSKKLNSSLPAMYSDLSQDSQLTENSSQEMPVQGTSSSTCVSSVVVEEEALLEPPSPMNNSTITAIAELSLPLRQKTDDIAGNCQFSSIEELLKKDLKLQSKVTVNIIKLLPSSTLLDKIVASSSIDEVSSYTSSSPKILRTLSDRPAPASVKAARSKIKSSTLNFNLREIGSVTNGGPLKPVALNENETTSKGNRTTSLSSSELQDKENSEALPLVNSLENKVTVPNALVRRVVPNPVKDDPFVSTTPLLETNVTAMEQSEKFSTSEDVVIVEDVKVDSESPVKENSPTIVTETVGVLSISSNASSMPDAMRPTICITCEDDQNALTTGGPSSLQSEKVNEGEVMQIVPNAIALSQPLSDSLDLFAESSQHQESGQRNIPVTSMLMQPKKFLKDHCTKAKAALVSKNRGNSPNTGKRGAHILELSRKISNEPPNKKPKINSSSPNGKQGKKLVGDDSSTSPLDKSPAREKEPWVRHTYSPYASPSGGILKKRPHADESDSVESSPTSLTKGRRVSFAFPEVSDSVDIPKVRSTRTRRSLLGTYKHSHTESETKANATSDVQRSGDEQSQPTSLEVSSDSDPIIPSDKSEKQEKTSSDHSEPSPSVIDNKLAVFVTSALTSNFAEASTEEENNSMDIDCNQSSVSITTVSDPQATTVEGPIAMESESQVPEPLLRSQVESRLNSEAKPKANETGDEELASSLESQISPSEGLDSQSPIFPDLIGCNASVCTIIDQLVSISWRAGMYELLGRQNIHTIGELCRLSAAEVQRLPLDPSRTVSALTNYRNEKDAPTPTVADLSYYTKSESTSGEGVKDNVDNVESVGSLTVQQKAFDIEEENPPEGKVPCHTNELKDEATVNSTVLNASDKELQEGNVSEAPNSSGSDVEESIDIAMHHQQEGSSEAPRLLKTAKIYIEAGTDEASKQSKEFCETDFDTRFLNLPLEHIMSLINRHPEKDAIYLSCNKQILLRAFPSFSDEK